MNHSALLQQPAPESGPATDVSPVQGSRLRRSVAALTCGAALVAAGCGLDKPDPEPTFDLIEVSNGHGVLLPHSTYRLDSFGTPTTEVLPLRSVEDIYANVNADNPILPVAPWPSTPVLPVTFDPGNHYLMLRLSRAPLASSFLDPVLGLTGAITVSALDPISGQAEVLQGRVFVGGRVLTGFDENGFGIYETWVELQTGTNGVPTPVALVPQAVGFPGTESPEGVQEFTKLLSPNSVVFVLDTDNDLSTHEAMPANRQIQMRISTALKSKAGQSLPFQALASSTRGADVTAPELGKSLAGVTTLPKISPGNGQIDVDPSTLIRIDFTEPIQPYTLGTYDNGALPTSSSALDVAFGPEESRTDMTYNVRAISPYDLASYDVVPAFRFPGIGPEGLTCDTFARVDIQVQANQLEDFSGNLNSGAFSTFFETGSGLPYANIPVAPDVIYIARTGSQPTVSVLDLNGFGAGTGNPNYDQLNPVVEGNSNFRNNPNLVFQGGQLFPPLSPGTCTLDGGSSGVFTLAKDSNLSDRLVVSPIVESVGDMMIGQPLDLAFNNAPPPFGCQSGNLNLCAQDGLKIPTPVQGATVSLPAAAVQVSTTPPGGGNLISWAPHPNPPALSFPPLCTTPFIGGAEPTSVDSVLLNNLLVPNADPFGNPLLKTPPSGLLHDAQNAYFQGPSRPSTSLAACQPYQIRQQVGHFLYVGDQARNEVVVLNSNTFELIDRIPVPDPSSFAMSPNVDLLAVSSRAVNLVSFIDIAPNSSTFHQVIKTTEVGVAPLGIAWQPDNEDILVCNEGSNSLSIISGFNLEVRNEITTGLNSPFEVAVGPRQNTFGFATGRYYAWILDRAGRVSLYESGPALVTGFGLDDIRQQLPYTFSNPKDIALDQTDLFGSVWVVHERPFDVSTDQPNGLAGGAVSRVANVVIQLVPSGGVTQLLIDTDITASIGPETLTGDPVAIAFDDLTNQAALPAAQSNFSPGQPAIANSKSFWRPVPGGAITTNTPEFMFLAIPNSTSSGGGVIEVIDLASSNKRVDVNVFQPGIQSVAVPGVIGLATYFSQ
jgi:YVTN family beta-propeller protein